MDLQSVRSGDIVECDRQGRRFFALATSDPQPNPRGGPKSLSIRPITAGITYRNATAPQVVGHYRRSKNSARAREEAA